MTLPETQLLAARNLIETYFTLASATEGTTVWQEDGFRVCIGEFSHPICNFAADLKLDHQAQSRLSAIAREQSAFNVYALPSDRPGNIRPVLEDLGFRLGHNLVQMGSRRIISRCDIDLIEAATHCERVLVAKFMAEQFFARQTASFRRRVVETTANAVDLPLYYVRDRGKIVCAAMVSLNQGSIGIYNLCVAPSERKRGFGTEMLRGLMNLSLASGRYVVLQCEESLKSWYCESGFEPDGTVEIYNLPKRPCVAIMESN